MSEQIPFQFVGWSIEAQECAQWRIEQPFRELRSQFGLNAPAGITVTPQVLATGDLIVGQRVTEPNRSDMWKLLKGKSGSRMVFELDDDFWHAPDALIGNQGAWNDPELLARLDANIALADLVTVSTDALAEVVRERHDNVVVLPNYIDGALLEVERPRAARLTVGWAGGGTHQRDLELIGSAVADVLAENPQLDVHLMGFDYRDALGVPEARFTAYQRSMYAYQRSLDFDIGLAPLDDTAFNRAKSHVRVLEYAALGIPSIASNVGAYADFIEDGVTGYLVSTPEEWAARLRELVADADARAEMGAAARRRAAEFTIQGHAHEWLIAYGQLI